MVDTISTAINNKQVILFNSVGKAYVHVIKNQLPNVFDSYFTQKIYIPSQTTHNSSHYYISCCPTVCITALITRDVVF